MNEKITLMLQQLADKMGTTVEYLWHVMVKQAYIQGVSELIGAAVVFIFTAVYLYAFIKWRKVEKSEIADVYRDTPFWVIIGGVISFAGVIGSMFMIADAITCLYNPEYWALQEVLRKL